MGCDAIPLQRHTHATHSSCDAVQIRCSPKLHFSRARTCLAFPKLYAAFAVLYQASALQSFAMPTLDGSMPLLLYAFPQLIYTIPMQNASTPRLANALHNHCVGFPCPCAALKGKATPEHHNADAICCFSYAVYFGAFAMPHQSHARPMRRCAKPLRRLTLQSRNDAVQCHCAASLRLAFPLRRNTVAGDDTSSGLRPPSPQGEGWTPHPSSGLRETPLATIPSRGRLCGGGPSQAQAPALPGAGRAKSAGKA